MPSSTRVEGIIATGDSVGLTDPVLLGGKDENDLLVPIKTDDTGRIVIVSNQMSQIAGPTQGPATITLTSGANTTIVAAPGAGFAIHVSTIQLAQVDVSTSTVIFKEGSGGTTRLSFTLKDVAIYPPFTMEPPWRLAENVSLVAQRTAGNKDIQINYHFYVEAV